MCYLSADQPTLCMGTATSNLFYRAWMLKPIRAEQAYVFALFQVDAKYLRNMRFSRKHNKSTAQQKKTFERRKVEGRPDKRPSLH